MYSYSDEKLLMLVLPLVLVAAVFAGTGSFPTAHAAGFPSGPGLVCLNDASAAAAPPANPCPSTPYTFDGPYPPAPQLSPTQIRVGVYVNGSAGLNGFDITLSATHTVLSPVAVDLTGSLLTGTPTIVVECLSGILVSGSNCFNTDTVDTVHFAATSQPGSPASAAPTSGLLFTAIYNIIGTAPVGGISVGLQSGCTKTSIPGGVCVTVTNGTTTPDSESIQTGTSFNNSGNSVPWIAETSNSSLLTAALGSSTGNGAAITTAPENGWPGFSTDSISFVAVSSPGFAAPSLSASTCSPAACNITATVSTATPGTYSATIYATYVALDPNGLTVTLVSSVKIQVIVQGVTWTINNAPFTTPTTDYLSTTAPMSLFFVAHSLGGYSGTLTFSTSSLSDGGTGITFAYPTSFIISSGATVTQAITATATAQGVALYQTSLNATGLPLKTSAVLTIKVSGFTLATNTTSLTFNAGMSTGISTTLTSLGNPASTNGFAGSVSITSSVTGPGKLTVTCKSPLTLTPSGTVSGTCSFTSTTAGTYTVTLTGTGGTNNDMKNSTSITITILTVSGFKLSPSPTSITVYSGTPGLSTLTVTSSGSFNQLVTITVVAYPSPLSCIMTPASVTPPAGGTATITLSCFGPAGVYTVTLTGASTGFASQTATVTYKVQDFVLTASAPSTVDSTKLTTSTITITSLTGFSGTVSLTATPSTSLTASLSSNLIMGGSGTSTLSISSTTAGTYTVTVTGTSGSLSHSVSLSVQVVDFQIFASPTIVSTTPGVAVTSAITLTPINGFTDAVTLTTSVSPATGLTCAIAPTSITGGSGISTLTCTGTGGSYTATVTGTTSASLSHTAMVTINVLDFQLTTTPNAISVAAGGCTANPVNVISLGGFVGTIALTTSAPSGLTATLAPTTIIDSGTSTQTVCAAAATPTGPYTVAVLGISGSVSHQTTVAITVTSGTSTTPPVISQATWNHRFSLSKYNNVLTFRLGALNPSTVTEYVSLRVVATDSTGVDSFILNSAVMALSPGQNLVHIDLSQTFTQSQVGETFTFNISIQWGLTAATDPAQLPFNSTANNGQPTSGSFTVLP